MRARSAAARTRRWLRGRASRGGDTDLRRIGETGSERVIAGGIQTVNTRT